jgi:hypothetical protein
VPWRSVARSRPSAARGRSRLELVKGIAECVGLQSEAKVDLEVVLRMIEQKITAKTLPNISINEPPPADNIEPEE